MLVMMASRNSKYLSIITTIELLCFSEVILCECMCNCHGSAMLANTSAMYIVIKTLEMLG